MMNGVVAINIISQIVGVLRQWYKYLYVGVKFLERNEIRNEIRVTCKFIR